LFGIKYGIAPDPKNPENTVFKLLKKLPEKPQN